jgi:hypothetical protein
MGLFFSQLTHLLNQLFLAFNQIMDSFCPTHGYDTATFKTKKTMTLCKRLYNAVWKCYAKGTKKQTFYSLLQPETMTMKNEN